VRSPKSVRPDGRGGRDVRRLPAVIAALAGIATVMGLGGGGASADVPTGASTGAISGVLTDQNGRPIYGIEVQAVPTEVTCPTGFFCGFQAPSSPNGQYTIAGLLPGSYQVSALDGNRSIPEGVVTVTVGVTGALNVRLPPPAVPAGTAARSAARDLAYLNAERARLGLPAGILLNTRWATECAAHDAYERDNGVLQHPESPGQRGASPGGAWAGLNSILAEFVWTRSANPWENAPIHLIQLFSPSLSVIGIDDSDGHQCATTWPGLLRTPVLKDTVFTYPGNHSRGVPPSENAAESPFVPGQFVGIPDGTTAGRELFVYLNQVGETGQAQVKVLAARLSSRLGSVRIRWVDNSTPTLGPYLSGGILIPVKPLSRDTVYTAAVVIKDGLGKLTHSWSFTTAGPARGHSSPSHG